MPTSISSAPSIVQDRSAARCSAKLVESECRLRAPAPRCAREVGRSAEDCAQALRRRTARGLSASMANARRVDPVPSADHHALLASRSTARLGRASRFWRHPRSSSGAHRAEHAQPVAGADLRHLLLRHAAGAQRRRDLPWREKSGISVFAAPAGRSVPMPTWSIPTASISRNRWRIMPGSFSCPQHRDPGTDHAAGVHHHPRVVAD